MNKTLALCLLMQAALLCSFAVGIRPVAAVTQIIPVRYHGMPAYRLTDGRTEAVVVPQIGRIMRYGKVGGENVLWNAPQRQWKPGEWKNYGGEKNWLSPQSSWMEFHGIDNWPPDPALDGAAYDAKIVAPGVLEMHSRVSPGTGVRLSLTLSFGANGDLVLRLSGSKSAGARVRAGLWSNAQVVPGAAVFLPVSPQSVYKQGYLSLFGHNAFIDALPDMIRVVPSVKAGGKIGVDSDVASIVSVSDSLAFLETMPKLPGAYPDGSDNAGLPVELYVNADPANYYCELELLGPLVHAKVPSTWFLTLHWSLHDLPPSETGPEQIAATAHRLLYGTETTKQP